MKTLIAMSLLMSLTACGGSATDQAIATAVEKASEKEEIKEEKKLEESLEEVSTFSRIATAEVSNEEVSGPVIASMPSASAFKLTDSSCIDPDLSQVGAGVALTLCSGSIGTGTYIAPAVPAPVVIDNTVVVADCSSNAQVGCKTTTNYKAADLSSLNASNVKLGVAIAGVTGSYAPPAPVAGTTPADCSTNLEIGCVSTSTFKAMNTTGLTAGVIKSGVSVAGITGQFPSVSYPLAGTNVADLDSATFNAKIKSATAFEWFDATGVRFEVTGSALLVAENLKKDISIFGATGTLDLTAPDAYDIRAGKTVNGIAGKMKAPCVLNSTSYGPSERCTNEMVDSTDAAYSLGYTCASNPEKCTMTDKNSALMLTPTISNGKTWATAKTYCDSLVYSGFSDWRSPTMTEISMFRNSFYLSYNTTMIPQMTAAGHRMWTSSTGMSGGWAMDGQGDLVQATTTNLYYAMCVRRAI